MLPISVALVCTVLLLIAMGFFTLGSLPLLVLKHDTPLDHDPAHGSPAQRDAGR